MATVEGLSENIQKALVAAGQLSHGSLLEETRSVDEDELETKTRVVESLLGLVGEREMWPLIVLGTQKERDEEVYQLDNIATYISDLIYYPDKVSLKLSNPFSYEGEAGNLVLSRPERSSRNKNLIVVNFVSSSTLDDRKQMVLDNRAIFNTSSVRPHHDQGPLWRCDVQDQELFKEFIDSLIDENTYESFLQDISAFFESALAIIPVISEAVEINDKTRARARESRELLGKLVELLPVASQEKDSTV